jgi:hypothetical protein
MFGWIKGVRGGKKPVRRRPRRAAKPPNNTSVAKEIPQQQLLKLKERLEEKPDLSKMEKMFLIQQSLGLDTATAQIFLNNIQLGKLESLLREHDSALRKISGVDFDYSGNPIQTLRGLIDSVGINKAIATKEKIIRETEKQADNLIADKVKSRIFGLVSQNPDGLRLSEIASSTNCNRSWVYRVIYRGWGLKDNGTVDSPSAGTLLGEGRVRIQGKPYRVFAAVASNK